ncbi:InlB B-repeat-containing protein, partial [Pontibacter sp. HJ8]
LYFTGLLTFQAAAQTSIVAFNSSWKYLDNGTNQGTAWRAASFSDGSWKTGNGKFGYGISDAATRINFGPNAKKKYITTYFRKSISLADPSIYSSYTAKVKRDDGVVVYVNGTQVYRNNLPSTAITYTTLATEANDNGSVSQSFTINPSAFIKGTNVIAVEVHQAKATTPDMAFDLELVGTLASPPPAQYTLTVTTAGSGTVSKSPNQTSYASGSTVSLTATPASGYQFAGWSGDASGNTNPLTVTMTGNKAITANFTAVPAQYSLAVSTNEGGTVTKDPDQASYTAGTTVKLTATPASEYQFSGWSGDASGNINPLIVTMEGNKAITATFTAPQDQTPPTVVSMNRQSPTTETTSATSLTYRTTFSEQVKGVDPADFTATSVSGTVEGAVGTVTAVGTTGSTYDVTVNSVSGEGTLRLDLKSSGTGITDMADNAINGGYTSGQSYVIFIPDQTAPSVVSISRQDPGEETTSAASVVFRATFSEEVSGVDAKDFTVTAASGSVSGTLATGAVVRAGTNGTAYDVTVSSISGSGLLRLDLNNSDTGISDKTGNPISGGYTSGESYNIVSVADQTSPSVVSINRQNPTSETTSETTLTFRSTFSEGVTGVDAADFAVTTTGTAAGSVGSVAAVGTNGSAYDVTVSAVSGEGTVRLDLKSSDTGITDAAENVITEGYTGGQTYTIVIADQTPPHLVSINRQDPSTETISATSVTFRADFSEQVTGVDASDFAATTVSGTVSGTLPGNAVTPAGSTGTNYYVTVSQISGSGTLRLDLKNSGTEIADVAGNAISGGYTNGETYTIEQASPPPPTESPKILYYEGFESGTGFSGMNIQTSTAYGFNVVGNPTYEKIRVGRWELRAGDPPASNGTRAEVLFSEALAQQETWHSFVGYFPSEDNLIDTDDEAFNQWHQGSSFGQPMMTFRTENGRFEVLRRLPDGSKKVYYILGSIIYDQWVHFVLHIKQHLTDGIMQVWINGELKMDYHGPTMFNGPIGRWKMGIYKSSWNNGATTNSIKRVWYVDEVKVGNAASTFDSMKPVSGNNIRLLGTSTQSILADMPPPTEEQAETFKISPTLAKRGSTVTIRVSDATTSEILVSDVSGRTLYTSKFTGATTIETTDLPSGMYFISFLDKKHSKKQKFIVTD